MWTRPSRKSGSQKILPKTMVPSSQKKKSVDKGKSAQKPPTSNPSDKDALAAPRRFVGLSSSGIKGKSVQKAPISNPSDKARQTIEPSSGITGRSAQKAPTPDPDDTAALLVSRMMIEPSPSEESDSVPNFDSPRPPSVSSHTSDSEPLTPQLAAFTDHVRDDRSDSSPEPCNYPALPEYKPPPSENPDEIAQQLLASFNQHYPMEEELAQLTRKLEQQTLALAFLRASKYLEQKQPFKAREWVKEATKITKKLKDKDNEARCLYWFGRIDWYEGRENDAYWHFKEASRLLARGCDEMRRIPAYLQWLRQGVGKDQRRAHLSRQGFCPPHENQPARVSRTKVEGSALPASAMAYDRYSHPGLKRKRENMGPDVAIALDLPESRGRRHDRSRAVFTFESDRHVHPGEETNVDALRLRHLAYDFSWREPQEHKLDPPFNTFDFPRNPKGRANRFRSHKIFARRPWEKKVPKFSMRNRPSGKADSTMQMLTDELNSTPYQGLRYEYRRRR